VHATTNGATTTGGVKQETDALVRLHPNHLEDLRRSGLSDETILANGLYSLLANHHIHGRHPVGEVRRTGRAHLPELRMAMPPRMQGRVDRVEKFGSLRAAIDLKCWDCTCGQVAETRSCPVVACSLHSVRPFRPATPVTV